MTTRIHRFHELLQRARALRGAAVVAIVNVTPDSFSDGGMFATTDAAIARCDSAIVQGADILDIGGESTRPGAASIDAAEQLRRVLPVVRYAASRTLVSVDTGDAAVARACLEAGAFAINDVRCGRDLNLFKTASDFEAIYILSHQRGEQATMRDYSKFDEQAYGDDVTAAVLADLNSAMARGLQLGLTRDAFVFDPGLGFTKSANQSMHLLRGLTRFVAGSAAPVLVGASRKSFIASMLTGSQQPMPAVDARLGGSLSAAVHAVDAGASMVRVHDVAATVQALELWHLLRPALASTDTRSAQC
jgi:dihydropteroate synthase